MFTSPTLKKSVLFHDLAEDGSFSMRRYGTELSQAISRLQDCPWRLAQTWSRQANVVARVCNNGYGKRFDNALTRYVVYPWQARKTAGDIFHILDHGYSQLLWALEPKKTVVTCHDLIPLLAASGKIPVALASHVGWTFRWRLRSMVQAARIIAISEATKRTMMEFLDIQPEQVTVIPYGVNKDFCPSADQQAVSAERRRWGIPEDAFCLLHVGTKGRYKNTPALLHALRLLNQGKQQRVLLLRIGADFYPDEKLLVQELGLEDKVIFAGAVNGDRALARVYQATDVLVFPSLWEGFGWPPLEAMACGIPVVSSNAASLPEVVGNAGVMVEPEDYEGLASGITRVLTDKVFRYELIARGLKRAGEFTWERTARLTVQVYDQVMHENSARY